jgi:hypothetical protein
MVTAPAGKILGGKHLATFDGTIGSNITLRAMAACG